MALTVLILVILGSWSIYLLQRGYHRKEAAFILAGTLVSAAAGGVLYIHHLMSQVWAHLG
jgi:uncharacterized membrane protein YfcA